MLTLRNISFFVAAILLAGVAVAQETITDPPPYDPNKPPTWNPPPPGFAPVPSDPNAPRQNPQGQYPSDYEDDAYFVPSQPNSGFDYFEDREEGYGDSYGSTGGSSSRGKREGKDSLKLLEGSQETCSDWKNSLLGSSSYPDKSACETELDRKVERGKRSIEDVYDKVELYKLKKVIRGQLASRAEAGKYEMSFDSLRGALQDASREGCTCK